MLISAPVHSALRRSFTTSRFRHLLHVAGILPLIGLGTAANTQAASTSSQPQIESVSPATVRQNESAFSTLRSGSIASVAAANEPVGGINTGLSGDDYATGPLPIGFSFKFYGTEYTSFWVTTNGVIQFSGANGLAGAAYSNGCLPGSAPDGRNDSIMVFWDDLITNGGFPNGPIQYQTIGSAPNRKLIVQWTNQYFFSSNLPVGTFQAVLSESSNEVKMQYRYLRVERSKGGEATIVIRGNSTNYTQFSCNQAVLRPEQAINYTPDASGLNYIANGDALYDFIDISDLTPDAPTVPAAFVNTTPSWSWSRLSDLNAYQIEIQTLDGAVVDTRTLGNVTSYDWTSGFTPGMSYRARIRGSVNSGSTSHVTATWSYLCCPRV